MKKLILPIILFFSVLFPTATFSQENKDCSSVWTSERYTCAGTYRKCYEECGAAPGLAREGCYKACDNASKACEKEADANFETCKNTGRQTSTTTEAKEAQLSVEPSKKPEDCWGKYMAADGCTPQFSVCTRECPKDASSAQRACEAACSKASQLCRDESLVNYRACVARNTALAEEKMKLKPSEPVAIQSDKPEANTSPGEPEEEKIKPIFEQFNNGTPVFIGDWFRSVADTLVFNEEIFEFYKFADQVAFGRDDREIAEENKDREARIKAEREQKQKLEQDEFEEFLSRSPILTDEEVSQIRKNSQNVNGSSQSSQKINSPYNLDILRGEAQIKLPGQNEWKALKAGDPIPSGSSIFTGMDSTVVLSIENKGVVQVQPFTEIKIDEKGLEQAAKSKQTYTDIKLSKGEVEVNVDKGIITVPILNIYTPNATTSIRGTHFWVKFNKDKRLTSVGVYEGEVEFKTREGKALKVTPVRDESTGLAQNKPGVAVVVDKLSPVKLGITGLVLLGIIGGAIFLLRRKFIVRGFGKKRR